MFKTKSNSKKITMNEGDFGIILPISFSDMNDGATIKFIIKKQDEAETEVLNLNFTVSSNKIEFQLTKAETEKLVKGDYLYDIKQYEEGTLQNTLLVDEKFIVEEGA